MRLYVGNIERTVTEEDLKELFQAHGALVSLALIKDRDTGESRGFAFAEFANKEEGEKAMQALDGQMLNGRALKVNEAKAKEDRPRPRRDFSGRSDSRERFGNHSREEQRGGFGGRRDYGNRSRYES